MNDFTIAAKHDLGDSPPLSLAKISLRLAQTPMKVLDYRFPCEVALDLLTCADLTARQSPELDT